ncbi:MAG: type II secretion system F family protein [Anaerolineaceae bacterium]
MVVLFVVVGIILAVAIALVVIGIRNPKAQTERLIDDRLESISQSNEQIDLAQLEMAQPFSERVILPVARKLGELAIRFTPQNWLNSISRKLELAGSPSNLDPSMYLSLQFICAFGLGILMIVVTSVLLEGFSLGEKLIYSTLGFFLGFFLPQIYLSSKITKRQKSIRLALPDAMDLLTICVEAGLGFDAAMVKVAEKWDSPLSLAFSRVIQEVQLGKLRREAMKAMAHNIDIPEMTSFVAVIIQSEMLGVSMARVLRIQSDQMRVKRRQRAEEEAHKTPIKMLIPMILLIFPSLLLVLFTPAVLSIMQSGLLGG